MSRPVRSFCEITESTTGQANIAYDDIRTAVTSCASPYLRLSRSMRWKGEERESRYTLTAFLKDL